MLMKIEDFIFYFVISCIVIYAIVQILKGDENNSLKQSLKMKVAKKLMYISTVIAIIRYLLLIFG